MWETARDRKEVFRALVLLLICITGLCSVETFYWKQIWVT